MINDHINCWNVKSSRSDIGCNKDVYFPRFKASKTRRTMSLLLHSVQCHTFDSEHRQRFLKQLTCVYCASEYNDRPNSPFCSFTQQMHQVNFLHLSRHEAIFLLTPFDYFETFKRFKVKRLFHRHFLQS